MSFLWGANMRRAGVLLMTCALLGCQAHVTLQAPRADAPLEERSRAYEKLKPLSTHEQLVVSVRGGTASVSSSSYLQLGGGQRVYYPEDLLPVLPVDSTAASAALDSQSARKNIGIAQGVGFGIVAVALAVGIGVFAGAPAVPDLPFPWTQAQWAERDQAEQARFRTIMTALGIGIGGAAAGALIALIGGLVNGRTFVDAARTSFETYDAGLRARLSLPPDGAPAPAQPAAVAPPITTTL
jgi:hypothetical protein